MNPNDIPATHDMLEDIELLMQDDLEFALDVLECECIVISATQWNGMHPKPIPLGYVQGGPDCEAARDWDGEL